jgi:hypothetical protein
MSFLLALAASQALAGSPQPWECMVKNPITHTIMDTDGYITLYDLPNTGWDPDPLLSSTFETSEEGCVTAWFSVHNLSTTLPPAIPVGDDYGVFVVKIDGNPMYGHISGCNDPAGNFVHCVVFSHDISNTRVDGHSYHFVYPTRPGKHTIEVFFAGSDATGSTERGAYVGGSILTLQYQ